MVSRPGRFQGPTLMQPELGCFYLPIFFKESVPLLQRSGLTPSLYRWRDQGQRGVGTRNCMRKSVRGKHSGRTELVVAVVSHA